jgi:hypothetical protein
LPDILFKVIPAVELISALTIIPSVMSAEVKGTAEGFVPM